MHLPPNHKPPGVSHKLRFQSTAQSAMHATGEQYANLEPYSERVQRLRERKMKNVTTSINFGFHQAPYETTMRSNDEYDRSVVLKPAGMDDDKILTPHEMKQKVDPPQRPIKAVDIFLFRLFTWVSLSLSLSLC